eukprot:CFRG1628T1
MDENDINRLAEAGENQEKMTKDYTKEADDVIEECTSLAKQGKQTEAIDKLLATEKLTRTGADMQSTGKLLVCIVEICFEMKDLKSMQEHIVMLTKRRGQLKLAVVKMVQKACEFVDKTNDKSQKLELIETLRDVTAGKIYVENERARLTMTLARIKEADGDISGAADVLQELQVETFGSMEKQEKIEFILEQMRLTLAKKDYIRTQIISKKISPRSFDNDAFQDEKLRFYKLMIELSQHDDSTLDICKYYQAIYNTKKVKEDSSLWKNALKNTIIYLVLSSHSNEQNDLLHRVLLDRNLEQLPIYNSLLTVFVTEEIQPWATMEDIYMSELSDLECFAKHEGRTGELRKRVAEHNMRVIAKCYTRIPVKSLIRLMDTNEDDLEAHISKLVTEKMIHARYDRPAGIVSFKKRQEPNDLLDKWVSDIDKLMGLVEKTTHLIDLANNQAALTS